MPNFIASSSRSSATQSELTQSGAARPFTCTCMRTVRWVDDVLCVDRGGTPVSSDNTSTAVARVGLGGATSVGVDEVDDDS